MALIQENINEIEEASSYETPGAGAYIGKIAKIVHEPDKMRIVAYIDIADGKFKGYGKGIEDRLHQDWGYVRSYLSYKKTALPFTVKNLNVIAESSRVEASKLKDDFNKTEGKSLEGKFVGFVIGLQEYRKKNGEVGLRFHFPELVSAKEVKEHPDKFIIPETIKLKEEAASGMGFVPVEDTAVGTTGFDTPINDEDVPW